MNTLGHFGLASVSRRLRMWSPTVRIGFGILTSGMMTAFSN